MKKLYRAAAMASLVAVLAGSCQPAWAQNVALPPMRVVVVAVTPSAVTVADANGNTAGVQGPIAFAPGLVVLDVVPGSLATVKPGSYIGTAAIKQPDGTYRAIELQIFPPALAGTGLGTHNWNLKPKSTMTNGTVRGLTSAGGTVGTVTSHGDTTLQVNDGTGEKTISLPAGAPVVQFVPGQIADIKPGAHALMFVSRTPEGKLVASRVNVGLNGLVPPM